MSPTARGLAALLCAAALLEGCKKEEPAPVNEDRTLEKLRQEVDRVNQGGAPSNAPGAPEDPNARLAGLAAGREADQAKTYALPSKEAVKVDGLSLQPSGLESLHSLSAGKVSLTTTDLFVRVKLEGQNTGGVPVNVPLSQAKLVDAEGKEYPIASDAQTVGGTRKLDHTWELEQHESLVLVFEAPPAAMAPGLALVIPTSGGENARIPLQ